MFRSKSNSVKLVKYKFQPTRFNENNELFCSLTRNGKCKLTGKYNFEFKTFEILYTYPNWFNAKHQRLLKKFLREYDWL